MPADSALAGLLCSIFVGPLGIQGFVVNPANPKYLGLATHQRRLSIAIITIFVGFIATNVAIGILGSTASEGTNESGTGVAIAGAAWLALILALNACLIASFIIAIVLLVRQNA